MQSDLFHKNVLAGYHDNASGRGTSVRIEPARILSVDREAWTVHAQPEGDDHIITDVPMLSLYEHVDGSGIYFLPRRGARGLLVYYDRGGPRFLCYRSEALGQETYKGKKYDLKEGDMILRSSYGSHVLLDDTGIVDLYSNPVLRMALMPYTNTLFMRSERLDLSLLGGRWMWSHQRSPRELALPRAGVGETTESPGKVTLTEEYRELANEDYRLSIRKGWHDDRTAYSVDYHEDDDKRVLYKIGKIDEPSLVDRVTESAGGDDRLLLDVDSGSYRMTIGERDDGTVVRTKVTGRSATSRGWRKETEVGEQDDDTIVHERVEVGPEASPTHSVDLSIKNDGQVDLDVNNGTLVFTIDAEGLVTLNTQGSVHVVVPDEEEIRLGGDSSTEQAIMGNLFRSYLNTVLLPFFNSWLSGHKAIGNLGAPISPPLPNEIADLLNNIGTAAGSSLMPESNLSNRVRIEP